METISIATRPCAQYPNVGQPMAHLTDPRMAPVRTAREDVTDFSKSGGGIGMACHVLPCPAMSSRLVAFGKQGRHSAAIDLDPL